MNLFYLKLHIVPPSYLNSNPQALYAIKLFNINITKKLDKLLGFY